MQNDVSDALRREFGYAPNEDMGEKWQVHEDRRLIIVPPYGRLRIYERGNRDPNNFYEMAVLP